MKLNNINKNGGIMKKLNAVYEAPNLEVAELLTEQSVLTGSFGDLDGFGKPGDAGQGSGYLDFDFYL